MVVESDDPLTPVELDHHEGEQVSVVLGTREVVVGLDQSVSSGVDLGEEVTHLLRRVVVDVTESLDVAEPLDVGSVVGKPDGGVEGHLVVLGFEIGTISSIALESFEKMPSNTL